MNTYVVTIKGPKNPEHNPHNKVTDKCLVSEECTDSTGEHHSYLVDANSEEVVRNFLKDFLHVTRIERVTGKLTLSL